VLIGSVMVLYRNRGVYMKFYSILQTIGILTKIFTVFYKKLDI